MDERPYLTYYAERGIIPVRQDTTDMERHLARRRALYRQLGILPLAFRRRTILEFGPGTGDNALFLASCAPELCVLVDGNPASIQAISAKLASGALPRVRFECRVSDIQGFVDARRFDIVLCEGVLPGQDSPETFLAHLASFAGEDGIVVITTINASSILAEVCRRVLKSILSTRVFGPDNLLEELTSFFAPDLNSLPGMSRRHDDWVLDAILHPWPARFTFTIPRAVETLADEFDVLGSSPHFIQDWRWYKSVPGHRRSWNDLALEEYARWAPYLLDYRLQPDMPLCRQSTQLDRLCEVAYDIHSEIYRDDAVEKIPWFIASLREIHEIIVTAMPDTAQSITDYICGMNQLLDGKRNADFGTFRSWFGRGQQYLSFTRK